MNQLERTLDVGSADLFPLAREAILEWKLQESAGVVARPARRVHVGQTINLRLNPVWPRRPLRLRGRELTVPVGSCEVVEVIDTARSETDGSAAGIAPEEFGTGNVAGFVYRTLPGHLESGEQTFLVSVGADERLNVSITSASTPGYPPLRVFTLMSVTAQKMMATRYADGMQRMLRQSDRRLQSDVFSGGQHATILMATDGHAESVTKADAAPTETGARHACWST